MNDIVVKINQNFFLLGITALLGNIGAKYVFNDFTPQITKILDKPFMRKIYVFSMVFLSTRNIKLAMAITIFYVCFIKYFKQEPVFSH